MSQKSYDNSPTLYLIPTPIGNMGDITLRTIEILKMVEVLFCEDTRVTGLLLSNLGIKKKKISNHDYNEEKNKELALSYLENGQSIGLVSDRGTPIVSDPGYGITGYVIEKGYNVVSLPGATALIPALITSGLNASHFVFYGFLNNKTGKRKEELKKLKNLEMTLIFYESPHRIEKSLKDMLEILGNRKVSIAREISKKFEEIYRGTLEEIITEVAEAKGEFVVVVDGASGQKCTTTLTSFEHVDLLIKEGFKQMDAIKEVAKQRGVPKNKIYDEYHGR